MASNDDHTTTIQYHEEYNEGFKIGIIVCLSIAAVVGFTGNGLVVAVILRAKKMRSVMNRFILHLAISDLIVSVLAIPMFLTINFSSHIPSADPVSARVMCKAARFFQYLSPEASMTLLITIGWNRHQAVVHPLNIMSYRTANKLILGAWIYALVMVAPSVYLTEIAQTPPHSVTNLTETYCATIPASTTPGLIYVMFLGTVGYLIPLASLIILYGKIYRTVWKRKSGALGDTRPVEAFIRSRKKVLKMFLTVIFFFLLTWLPLLLYVGAIEWTIKKTASHVDYVRLVTYSLGLCNSVCNPFIYALFNAKFREGCKGLFRESFNIVRLKKSPGSEGALRTAAQIESPQAALSRRGGFHGTKGNQKKPSAKQESARRERRTKKLLSVPIKQLVFKRFKSLSDLDSLQHKGTNETVELVSFQSLDTSTTECQGIAESNPKSSSNSDSCIAVIVDDVFLDNLEETSSKKAADPEMKGKASRSRDGYNSLKEELHFPATRSKSEGYGFHAGNKRDFQKARNRSTPVLP